MYDRSRPDVVLANNTALPCVLIDEHISPKDVAAVVEVQNNCVAPSFCQPHEQMADTQTQTQTQTHRHTDTQA